MIKGIGIDIIEVKRFRSLPYKKNRSFYSKIFSSREIEYCIKKSDPYQHFAARFAGKEAVLKALGKNIFKLKEIEILNDVSGRPMVKVKRSKSKILISLSHTRDTALACALWLN